MVPVLFEIGSLPVGTHDVFVVLGVGTAVGVLWWRSRGMARDPRLPALVAGGIFTGAVFAKLSTGWQYIAFSDSPSLFGLLAHGGQSVLGGLAGAYLGVVLTKRLIGYQSSTGDWFAPAVAAGLAVGRVGCFLTEQVGTATTLPWGITVSPEVAAAMPYCPSCATGMPMHPSFIYEILFHLTAFFLLIRFGDRSARPGDTFKLYLVAYAVFRFGVEFVRENPEMALGLSGSQLFLLATVPLGVTYYLWRRRNNLSKVQVAT
ncbi:MAG: prolipoprotein diacylglyceryl transferase [Acidimicrobiia bacterium]|nr:prolipoprotein diacylglyceryl transferase [Acidimicrobiia bacterium]